MNQVPELTMQLVITVQTLNARISSDQYSNRTRQGADESDAITQSNVMDVTQNLQGTNDCDEANTGDNNAQCTTNVLNNIDIYIPDKHHKP